MAVAMSESVSGEKSVNIYYPGFRHRVGGAFIHVAFLRKGLEELGYEVRVITLDSLPPLLRYLPHLVQKAGNALRFPFGYLYKGKSIRLLYRLFFQNSADIEIYEDIYIYSPTKQRSLVFMHAPWSDNLHAYDYTDAQRRRLEREEAKIINAFRTGIVTVSEPYRAFMESRLRPAGLTKQIGVVELGVDIDKFVPDGHVRGHSVVFVGLLEARKNIKLLLDIYGRLKAHDGRYTLTIIGDGPQRRELDDYIRDRGIADVAFLGRLSHDEVLRELPKHDLYVHTSKKESFSYALLEAKLSGLVTAAYGGLEVPSDFIDIKTDAFEAEEWFEKITGFDRPAGIFDKQRYAYQAMTKHVLERLT